MTAKIQHAPQIQRSIYIFFFGISSFSHPTLYFSFMEKWLKSTSWEITRESSKPFNVSSTECIMKRLLFILLKTAFWIELRKRIIDRLIRNLKFVENTTCNQTRSCVSGILFFSFGNRTRARFRRRYGSIWCCAIR